MKLTNQQANAYAHVGTQSHVTVLLPALRELLGDAYGKTLLDFGCARGELSLALARLGFAHVTCIEENPALLAEAQEYIRTHAGTLRDRFTFCESDEHTLPLVDKVDVVTCTLVLMMCSTRQRLHEATRGLVQSLKPDGQLLLTITHPCFRNEKYRTFHYQLPRDYNYWSAGMPYDVIIEPNGQPRATLTDHHWKLEDYIAAIHQADGVVTQLRELPAAYEEGNKPQGPPAYVIFNVSRR